MLNLNKAQDAIGEFLKNLSLRIASLFARLGATSDEAAKAIPILRVEGVEALDALERLADSLREDTHSFIQSTAGLLAGTEVNITMHTPGGDKPWRFSIQVRPPEKGEGE